MLKPMISLAEKGWLPDWAIRAGIRQLCQQRLEDSPSDSIVASTAGLKHIAVETERANEQHYELTSLSCAITQITDAGLKEVARLPQLTVLDLTMCKQITDAGLKAVAKLPQLTELNLFFATALPMRE